MGFYDKWDSKEPATEQVAPSISRSDRTTAYGRRALDAELAKLGAASEGTRNYTLNEAAFNVAQLVNAGHVDHDEAEQLLESTARQTGLPDREIHATMRSAGSGAELKPRLDVPDPDAEPVPPPVTLLRVEDTKDFWESRPVIQHVRDFARARRVSPWALLGITLTRVVVATPPFAVLPALIGGHASLNLFIGIVGFSGDGKGGAESASADVLNLPEQVETHNIGSGEAIAHAYMERTYNKATKEKEIHQHNDRALFSVAEIDTLTALHNRQSSTVLAELRKAWMGERLGFHYVDRDKRLPVPGHAYRLCMVAGIQPGRARVLLDDADGGTPQRFIWLPASDPDAPDMPPDEPKPWPWRLPKWPLAGAHGVTLPVCETARRAVDEARLDRLRGNGDALEGHTLLARLKAAVALAILDQRGEVNDEDWELAGTLMDVSHATREQVQQSLSSAEAERNKARGIAEAERVAIVEEQREEAAIKRVTRAILRRLDAVGDQGETEGKLRANALAPNDRTHFAEAVTKLISDGLIEAEETAQSTRYKRRKA